MEEIFKSPSGREWLEWSDFDRKFLKADRIMEFYGWVVGGESEEGEKIEPKLPGAKSTRELSKFLNDENSMAIFRSPNGTLTSALAKYESTHHEEWLPLVIQVEGVLAALSPDTLRSLTKEEINAISDLFDRTSQIFKDRDKLKKK